MRRTFDRTGGQLSIIDQLNDQVHKANSKIEQHLDAQAQATTTTANVSITLATALAAGLAVLAREALPSQPPHLVSTCLVMGAVFTVLSLGSGVFVYLSAARISRRAVLMWTTSKEHVLQILLEGGGDEAVTQAAYALAVPRIAEELQASAERYELAYSPLVNAVSVQVASLSVGVVSAMVAAFAFYIH